MAIEHDIRRRRQEVAWSQADLAHSVGVSRQTISSLEAKRYVPSLGLALRLARFFGVSVEELFRDTDALTWPKETARPGPAPSARDGDRLPPSHVPGDSVAHP